MPRITLPAFLLDLGAKLGDLANRLGWMPPMRSTAIAELRRGVTGDPARLDGGHRHRAEDAWRRRSGTRAATIQDKWFARLFLVKALVIASLAVFWIVSGFISLVISYRGRRRNFALARLSAVAGRAGDHPHQPDGHEHRRADRLPPHRAFGLIAGIVVSLGYMVGAAILTPDLWIEPLGALVKTGPAIVLMLVALLTLDNR